MEAGAQPSGQADVLGLESNERTSAAVALTVSSLKAISCGIWMYYWF